MLVLLKMLTGRVLLTLMNNTLLLTFNTFVDADAFSGVLISTTGCSRALINVLNEHMILDSICRDWSSGALLLT